MKQKKILLFLKALARLKVFILEMVLGATSVSGSQAQPTQRR